MRKAKLTLYIIRIHKLIGKIGTVDYICEMTTCGKFCVNMYMGFLGKCVKYKDKFYLYAKVYLFWKLGWVDPSMYLTCNLCGGG